MRSRPSAASVFYLSRGAKRIVLNRPRNQGARQETLGHSTILLSEADLRRLRRSLGTAEATLVDRGALPPCRLGAVSSFMRAATGEPIWRAGPIAAILAARRACGRSGGRALATWHPKLKRVAGTLAPRLIAPRRPPRRRRGRSRERDKTAGRHRSTHTSRATHRFYQPHRSSSRPSRARRSRWTSSRPTRSTT